ncbi:PAAR domain-containing protein [Herbaspirillum seropedicae]|uniref:PAAR domain-containing protein n=1 Tax=Herbaspirillum seropedicae TaxID=964 RepID=UPI0028628C93|nr:PAAR domain-containing protein [Herbaspirillum seropedicae]MDR6394265.1 putative Zn-binding protein involved in type VI secretion [Herbaspirillum seropedicae]
MPRNIIVLGDKTSHGGAVISASMTSTTHGKGWARVGDMVSCPRCRGVFPIVEGDATLLDEGKAVTHDGCKVACGAILICSQLVTSTDPFVVTASSDLGLSTSAGTIGSNLLASYHDEPLDNVGERFRGRFQVIDSISGKPIADQAVRVRSSSGQYLTGTTDAEGFTQWVERSASEALAFDLFGEGAK